MYDKSINYPPRKCHFHGFAVEIEEDSSYCEFTSTDVKLLQSAAEEYLGQQMRTEYEHSLIAFAAPSNWPTNVVPNAWGLVCAPIEFGTASILVGFSIAGIIYGSMHLIGWSAPFETHLEAILWRISCCILISSGFVLPILQFSSDCVDEESWIGRIVGAGIGLLVYVVLAMPTVLCWACLYVLGRVFLVVECFLELFHLPNSVFSSPYWSQYIPHLS